LGLIALAVRPAPHRQRRLIQRVERFMTSTNDAFWSMTDGEFNSLIDEKRTTAYGKAIAATIRPDDVVVDMGTSSCVLAMLAARDSATVDAARQKEWGWHSKSSQF
jgi:hypothetical protein